MKAEQETRVKDFTLPEFPYYFFNQDHSQPQATQIIGFSIGLRSQRNSKPWSKPSGRQTASRHKTSMKGLGQNRPEKPVKEGALPMPQSPEASTLTLCLHFQSLRNHLIKTHSPKSFYFETHMSWPVSSHLLKQKGWNQMSAKIPSRWFPFFQQVMLCANVRQQGRWQRNPASHL